MYGKMLKNRDARIIGLEAEIYTLTMESLAETPITPGPFETEADVEKKPEVGSRSGEAMQEGVVMGNPVEFGLPSGEGSAGGRIVGAGGIIGEYCKQVMARCTRKADRHPQRAGAKRGSRKAGRPGRRRAGRRTTKAVRRRRGRTGRSRRRVRRQRGRGIGSSSMSESDPLIERAEALLADPVVSDELRTRYRSETGKAIQELKTRLQRYQSWVTQEREFRQQYGSDDSYLDEPKYQGTLAAIEQFGKELGGSLERVEGSLSQLRENDMVRKYQADVAEEGRREQERVDREYRERVEAEEREQRRREQKSSEAAAARSYAFSADIRRARDAQFKDAHKNQSWGDWLVGKEVKLPYDPTGVRDPLLWD